MRTSLIFWLIAPNLLAEFINENDWGQLKIELQKCYPEADKPCEVSHELSESNLKPDSWSEISQSGLE